MNVRPSGFRLRERIVALLVVLVVLWGYATYLTARDAADLLRVQALGGSLGRPTDALILSLQAERRLTVTGLAGPVDADAQAAPSEFLAERRADTDRAVARLREFGRSDDPRLVGAGAARERADGLLRLLDSLGELRGAVDAGRLDRDGAATGYTEMIDAGFAVYAARWAGRESTLIERTRAFLALARAREALARQDAVVTGMLSAGRLTEGDESRIGALVAVRRFVLAEAAAGLPDPTRTDYQRLADGREFTALRELEDEISTPGGAAVPPELWRAAVDPVLAALRELVADGVRDSVERSTLSAAAIVVRGGVVGGLGFLLVVAAIAGTVRASRRLTRRLESDRRTRELFLHLNRNNQVLLRQQLDLLDAMERREPDPDELADLFRVDHLATRLRRNVEKMVTAAGGVPARRWRRPVPLVDVIRGAVAEVEDYQRVLVSPACSGALAGPAVPDVIHMLAELIENGLTFSKPDTTVRVHVECRDGDRVIAVLDRGLGMSESALAAANSLLRDAPPIRPADAGHGLYGVAQTARRWGVVVELAAGRRGGTAARVLIPAGLVVTETDTDGTAAETAETDADGIVEKAEAATAAGRSHPR